MKMLWIQIIMSRGRLGKAGLKRRAGFGANGCEKENIAPAMDLGFSIPSAKGTFFT